MKKIFLLMCFCLFISSVLKTQSFEKANDGLNLISFVNRTECSFTIYLLNATRDTIYAKAVSHPAYELKFVISLDFVYIILDSGNCVPDCFIEKYNILDVERCVGYRGSKRQEFYLPTGGVFTIYPPKCFRA